MPNRRDLFQLIIFLLVAFYIFKQYSKPKIIPKIDLGHEAFVVNEPPVIDDFVEFGEKLFKPCEIADWNQVTTRSVKNSDLHRLWAQRNLGNVSNLFDAQLRPLSAFVYKEEIVVTTTTQNRYGQKVYCRYYDCNRQELNDTAWETIMFPLSAAYCTRRAGAMYMTLTDTRDEKSQFDPVPLIMRIQDGYQHEISVCVGPIYGIEKRWLEIAETTEHHLLMGIRHFYYTILNRIDDYTRKIIDEYQRLGYFDVTVIQNEYEIMDWMSHLPQIYDCHFRSRYHSKWVLNVDIDERLVMVKMPILNFLNTLDEKYGEVVIGDKRIIRTDLLPEKYTKDTEKEFEFRKYDKTMKTMWISPKSIFRPEKVDALFYHWSYVQYPGVLVKSIEHTEAYIRHYRTAQRSLLKIWFLGKIFVTTKLNPSFEEKLTENVVRRLDSVYNQRPMRCEEMRQILFGRFEKYNYNCQFRNGKFYNDVGSGSKED